MKVTLINGQEVDLKELKMYSGWKGNKDNITLFSKNGDKVLTTINVNILINCWIEKEEADYESYLKSKKETKQK